MHLLLAAGSSVPFLAEVVGLFALMVIVAYLSHHFRLVPLTAYLVAGILIGPSVLGLVKTPEVINTVADIGVILLLFTIGVEFSLEKLARLQQFIVLGGTLQVSLTTLMVMGLLAIFGITGKQALFTGFMVALSSTAIVLKLLAERRTLETLSGQISVGILLFQDLAVVLIVALLPILAGQQADTPLSTLLQLGEGLLFVGLTIVLARRTVPWFLEKIVHTQSQELFLLTVVAICLGVAWITDLAGIGVGLGAFLAGLIISESRYSEHAVAEILPLQTIFSAMFFVSVGMLLDVQFFLEHPLIILAIVVAVILIKFLTVSSSVLIMGYPWHIALATGLALVQIGEFSFVLDRIGAGYSFSPLGMGEAGQQIFIAVTILTMLATPFLLQAESRLTRRVPTRRKETPLPEVASTLRDHVILVGFGPGGQRLAGVLAEANIPFVIIDFNPFAVAEAEDKGYPAIYGDASRLPILEAARIHHARAMAVNINDPAAARRLVELARHLNPALHIVVRTKFTEEVEPLLEAGADAVIPEDLEITVQLFAHILHAYEVAPEEIASHQQSLRTEGYAILRHRKPGTTHKIALTPGPGTRILLIRPNAPAAGKTLGELGLRPRYGLTVLAIFRESEVIYNPDAHFRLRPGDRILVLGQPEDFARAMHLFRPTDTRKKVPDDARR